MVEEGSPFGWGGAQTHALCWSCLAFHSGGCLGSSPRCCAVRRPLCKPAELNPEEAPWGAGAVLPSSDMFLLCSGIYKSQKNGIVRVGGRSSSEVLKQFTLRELRKKCDFRRNLPPHLRRAYVDVRTGPRPPRRGLPPSGKGPPANHSMELALPGHLLTCPSICSWC